MQGAEQMKGGGDHEGPVEGYMPVVVRGKE
jgi:hypothetical protein